MITARLQLLKDKGLLQEFYMEGYINHVPIVTLEVRNKVDALMRQGKGKEDAVRMLIGEMGMSRSTIYRYL